LEPSFWKLSQGVQYFSYKDMLQSIEKRLVYIDKEAPAKGQRSSTQAHDFINAPVGDYFYLTHGNNGIYLLGQFVGPANIFSQYGEGWIDRPFRLLFPAIKQGPYTGPVKWWTPNEPSTFTRVPLSDLSEFEESILKPFFDVKLKDYGLKTI
jgi:hypothetical protein